VRADADVRATISAESARWIATAASTAAFGFSNDAKNPSPSA
jgi:hypothetical protein